MLSVYTRLAIQHAVEDEAPFANDGDLRMDIPVPAGHFHAPTKLSRHKGLLVDVTFPDPQAAVHLRNGSADVDRSATATSEARKIAHYYCPGCTSLDSGRWKLCTLAVVIFGRLGIKGYEFVDQVATSVVGEMGSGLLSTNGVVKNI